ncbi:RecQ family ATP-dependent DNA helicase [Halomonas sp. V046]|uniref:RecQ family ATP-dependent DNA helicase n=1 Tax=Halomonas sp. V046 TaxID=3459611 RepID=UPI0040440A1C
MTLSIDQTLSRVFGHDQFRPGQRPVIEALTQGRSAAAIFPTGSGKSLCYQLPALHLPHLTLVISPLLALMQDQLAALKSRGINAGSIDSGQDREQTQAVMRDAREGRLKVLMISVERLKNERFREFIRRVPISLLVVDEAHCISEWGHNFRPDYLKLPDYRRDFAIEQVLLLTATATPRVIDDMCRRFSIAESDVVSTGFYRPNLDLSVAPVQSDERPRRLVEWLKPRLGSASSPAATIVYVTLQQTAERLAAYLAAAGLPAAAYHAGLDAEIRQRLQADFMAGRLPCIVATIAFGMGIDKADIRAVVHFDLPKSIENYSQEIGRAGRDGQRSECLMLAGREHLAVLENFVHGDVPPRHGIRSVLEDIRSANRRWELTLTALSAHTDIRPLPLKTLLVKLELAGVLRPSHSYFADYRFRLEEPAETLLARFNAERGAFIQAILEAANKARTWYSLDFAALETVGGQRGIDVSRPRVLRALDYFAEQGLITLEAKQMTEVFEVLAPVEPDALSDSLHRDFVERADAEITRLSDMLTLFEADDCLSARLADWFGDTAAPRRCGHCSACRGEAARLPAATPPTMPPSEQLLAWLSPLRDALSQQAPDSPFDVHLATRFLCGITSPWLTRLKARRLSGFAALESQRYRDVVDAVTPLV